MTNSFYILAHDPKRLENTLNLVNDALNDLKLYHKRKIFCLIIYLFLNKRDYSIIDDQFYADSYGSGLLLRGVLLHFLHRYDDAHRSFDEIIHMFVFIIYLFFVIKKTHLFHFRTKSFSEKSFLAANALLEKALIYLGLKQKQKAMDYLHKSL